MLSLGQWWQCGVVVSGIGLINKVNRH